MGPATTPAPSWDLFVRDKPSKERLVFFGGLIINTPATSFVLCSKETEGLVVGGKGAHKEEQQLGQVGCMQCAGGGEADDVLIASQSGANGLAFFFFLVLPNETASAGGPKLPRAGD